MPDHKWTAAQKKFVLENAGLVKDKDLAFRLSELTGEHVSTRCVARLRQKLGVKKRPGAGKCEVVPAGR